VRYRTALQPLTETSLPSASASATTGVVFLQHPAVAPSRGSPRACER
jgi:hypothetical protein